MKSINIKQHSKMYKNKQKFNDTICMWINKPTLLVPVWILF